MTTRRKNLFVTGRPGIGKTTLIERVLEERDVRLHLERLEAPDESS